MVDVKNQRRMAAEIMKCGANRVWMDPNHLDDEHISGAVTRDDIRSLINIGYIKAMPKNGNSRGRIRYIQAQKKKGKRKGQGSRKGTKFARVPKKRRWISTIRPIRSTLRELKAEGKIDASTYRKLYRVAKGGSFKNKNHLLTHMRTHGLMEE